METMYAFAPYCKYALLSEDFESGLGWSYTRWMKHLEDGLEGLCLQVEKHLIVVFHVFC